MAIKKTLFFPLICLILFSVLSCAGEKSFFYPLPGDGGAPKPIAIRNDKKTDNSETRYRMSRPFKVDVSDSPRFFRAEISLPTGQYSFVVITESGEKNIDFITDQKSDVMLFFTVIKPDLLKGFAVRRIDYNDEEEELSQAKLVSVREIDKELFFEGYSRSEMVLLQSENFSQSASGGHFRYSYSPIASGSGFMSKRLTINLDTSLYVRPDEEVDIVFKSEGMEKSISVYPVKGVISITSADIMGIFSDFTGKQQPVFSPAYTMELSTERELNLFKTISVSENKSRFSSLSAIEADFSTILGYDQSKWRHDSYELFSWSVIPEFLIIDTLDYSFQSAMFKRLSFFVEKSGWAGKLLTDAQLEGLHGWNAHDYRAEDICDFFNLADRTGFVLSQEEELLKAILLENRIIRKSENIHYPEGGGILSVSRESSPRLRRVFFIHEGYHGVFFASEEFRKACSLIWEKTSPEVKEFWQFFLLNKGYDIENQYLLINEFMAYNLQQTPEEVDAYFFEYIIPALYSNYPAKRDFLDLIAGKYREEFSSTGRELAETLYRVTGLPPGNLFFIRKK